MHARALVVGAGVLFLNFSTASAPAQNAAGAAGAKPAGAKPAAAAQAGAQAGAQAATSYPEMATPKGALAFFSQSIREADVAKLKACMHATSALEQRMADSTSEVAAALSRLRLAAVEKFGEPGGITFQGGVPTEDDVKRIQSAEEKIEGDTAIVTVAGGASPQPTRMRMVKVNGAWKISVAHMVAGQSPAVVDNELKKAQTTMKVVNETIDEIKSGKHATDKAASEALKNKMKAAFPPPAPAKK